MARRSRLLKKQELRQNKRRNTKTNKQGLFSGLIFCADCRSKLHFATCKRFGSTQDLYCCSKYKGNTGSCTALSTKRTWRKSFGIRFFKLQLWCTTMQTSFSTLCQNSSLTSGYRVQKIQIVFNFIGEYVPQDEFIPDKKIPQAISNHAGMLPYQPTLFSSVLIL